MGKVPFRYDSYCGIYCGACDTLLATEHGCLSVLAREWHRTVGDLRCHGCRSTVNSVFCRDCLIRRCAHDRGVERCGDCPQFPCSRLASFQSDGHAHHTTVLENLAAIRRDGVESWLDRQHAYWRCAACGSRASWYDRVCVECGTPLPGCMQSGPCP